MSDILAYIIIVLVFLLGAGVGYLNGMARTRIKFKLWEPVDMTVEGRRIRMVPTHMIHTKAQNEPSRMVIEFEDLSTLVKTQGVHVSGDK